MGGQYILGDIIHGRALFTPTLLSEETTRSCENDSESENEEEEGQNVVSQIRILILI